MNAHIGAAGASKSALHTRRPATRVRAPPGVEERASHVLSSFSLLGSSVHRSSPRPPEWRAVAAAAGEAPRPPSRDPAAAAPGRGGSRPLRAAVSRPRPGPAARPRLAPAAWRGPAARPGPAGARRPRPAARPGPAGARRPGPAGARRPGPAGARRPGPAVIHLLERPHEVQRWLHRHQHRPEQLRHLRHRLHGRHAVLRRRVPVPERPDELQRHLRQPAPGPEELRRLREQLREARRRATAGSARSARPGR